MKLFQFVLCMPVPSETGGTPADGPEISPDMEVPERETTEATEDEKDAAETKTRKRNVSPRYPTPDGGLTEVPEDYDGDKYRALLKSDFAGPSMYYRWKAGEVDNDIKKLEDDKKEYLATAERYEKLGSAEQAKKVDELHKYLKRFETIQKELEESGVDSSVIEGLRDKMLTAANPEEAGDEG